MIEKKTEYEIVCEWLGSMEIKCDNKIDKIWDVQINELIKNLKGCSK